MCNKCKNNQEIPQEVTYTSVCNSDNCRNCPNCNCCNQFCENDSMAAVMCLSERMEECCSNMHAIIDDINCKIEQIMEMQSMISELLVQGDKLIINLQH